MKKNLSQILKRPRITEKAGVLADKGVYVFEVLKEANKNDISNAIKLNYKVTPLKIAVVNIPPKRVVVRGKRGVKSGYKKAYVYLKSGEKIEI